MRVSASKRLGELVYRSGRTMRKRRMWLEKDIEKLEKAGIKILWIRPLYLPKNIILGFVFKVKTEKTVLEELRVYSKSSWIIYNPHRTTYNTKRTIEECIKEIEGGKD